MNSNEDSRPRTRSRSIKEKSTDNAGGKIEGTIDGLPHGWIKEVRFRKGSKGKKDPFYIDPVSGYEFRSLKDVQRYIQTGDITKCAIKPQKRKISDMHIAEKESLTAMSSQHTQLGAADNYVEKVPEKNSNNIESTVSSEIENIKSIHSGSEVVPMPEVKNLPEETQRDPVMTANSASMLPSELKNIGPLQTQANKAAPSEGKTTAEEETKVTNNGVPSLPAVHTSGKTESVTEKAKLEARLKEKKRKTKPTKQFATPVRVSPRLAALRADEMANEESDEQSSSAKQDLSDQLQPNQVDAPKLEAGSSSFTAQQDGAPAAGSSEKLENQNTLAEQSAPPKQPEPVEPAVEKPGSALSSIFGNSWPDPCIEFAFKTLTGDIPVLDDTASVADYFHQPQDSSKGTTANCSASAYDSSTNHNNSDHVGLPRSSDKLCTGSGLRP